MGSSSRALIVGCCIIRHLARGQFESSNGYSGLSEDISLKHKIVVSLDPAPRQVGDIRIYPYRLFLEKLWNNTLKIQ
ncbi:MAG: hypothetical protein DRP60_17055 [Spirochaetes bacterium]|nr:MAG: hypothetical protein DRP60_17055 [Spirochaetota bacterium]